MSRPQTPGQYLVQLRTAKGAEQSDIARQLKLHPQSVSNWERDSAPIPAQHIPGLKRALPALNGSVLLDLMASHYRARVAAAVHAAYGKGRK
jgi:transcriptional regulator with XRE-family HTH domain